MALAALALAMAWLLPNHHWPWADFYSDAWASLVLWFVAASVLWRYRKPGLVDWHLVALVAFACCGVVGIQYAGGLIESAGTAWTSALYLLGLTIALTVGAAWERARPGACADVLFTAVLAGALLSLLVQFQQWLRIDVGDSYWLFLPAPARRFHANLGQPNQLATLICLGVLACAWFHEKRRIPASVALGLSALLAIGLAVTESRTSWVVMMVSLSAFLVWRKRLGLSRGFIVAAGCWSAFFVGCVFALPLLNTWLGVTPEPQGVRGLGGGTMRLDIWKGVWDALLQKPWAGYGWMQTSLTQFPTDPYQVVVGDGLRHAHNLLLDLLVYLGIPMGLAVCAILVTWFWKAMRRIEQKEQLWMLLFVTAVGVHAMLEFPLHYAYFLLPIGLMVGAINTSFGFQACLQTPRWLVALLLAATGAGWVVTARDYLPIEENFFALRFERQRLASPDESTLPSPLVLTHLQDLLWLGRADPTKAHSDADIERALRVSKLTPSLVGQYKLAAMYALAGKPREAEYWLVITIKSNDMRARGIDELRQQWQALAAQNPSMAEVNWPRSAQQVPPQGRAD